MGYGELYLLDGRDALLIHGVNGAGIGQGVQRVDPGAFFQCADNGVLAPAAAELVRLVRGRVKGCADIDDFMGTTNRKETPS